MRVLVTGASGFVGRHVADVLRDGGHDVVCLVRRDADAADLAGAGHGVVRGDLSDAGRLASAVDGCDAVAHVAGMIAARSFREMRDVNEAGAGRLASACRRARTPPRRFVLVSSLAATGPSSPGRPVRDGDPPRPVSRYGWSKLLGERAARRGLGGAVGLTVLRPPAVFGPRDRGVFKFFLAASRGVVPRIGSDRRELSLVHGPDLARAVRAAIEAPTASGRVYHVADPEVVDMNAAFRRIGAAVAAAGGRAPRTLRLPGVVLRAAGAVAEEASRLAGRVPPLSRDKVAEILAPGWACDASGASADLGWAPRLPLDAALAETAAWYREHRWI